MAAPPHYLPLVVPLRPGPVLCVLLVPTLPLLAILLSNALTFSRTCPSLRLLVLPWPSLLPFSPCLRFLSLLAALPLALVSLLPLLLLPEVVIPLVPQLRDKIGVESDLGRAIEVGFDFVYTISH